MMATGSKLLDVLPDDTGKADGILRVYDFGLLIGRAFIDLHRSIIAHAL